MARSDKKSTKCMLSYGNKCLNIHKYIIMYFNTNSAIYFSQPILKIASKGNESKIKTK